MVYEQKLLVLYSCLLYSIVFATLFLPFSIAFFIACNQNNSRNRQTANANKLTKAKERNLLITAHCTLTSVWPSCFLKRSRLLHWLPAAKWRTCNSFLGLNFRTRLHSTLRKKGEKRKCWGRLVDRLQAVPLQSVESKLGRTGESEMAEGELPLGFLFFTFTRLAPFPRSHDHPGDWSQSNLWKV